MATITTTILALAAVASTAAAVNQAQVAKEAGKAQARNLRAEQKNKELEYAENTARNRERAKRTLATIRARMAQSGVDTDSGTPLVVLGENARNIETGFQDAARAAAMQSSSLASQAAAASLAGNQAYNAGLLSAAGTAAKGASGVYSSYNNDVYTGQSPDTFGIYRTRSNG